MAGGDEGTPGDKAIVQISNIVMYSPARPGEYRQGEIISSVTQYTYNSAEGSVDAKLHTYVIIASQDCDLLQDFNARSESKVSDLNSVLCYEAHPATDARGNIAGSDIWKRIIQNKDERYQLLQSISTEEDCLKQGLPDLIIDFKRFFSITIDDLDRQVAAGEAIRRTSLESPYREHFQSRAAYYLQRVGLPYNHKITK